MAPDPARPPSPSAGDWIDLLALLHADEGRPLAELRARDRVIGRELAAWSDRPAAQLVAWVRAVRRAPLPGGVPPVSAAAALRLCALALAGGGLVFGMAAAAAAFAAGPGHRTNAVAVLGLLLGVQWVFLLLALVNALPPRARRWLPWLGSEPEGGGWLQPAYAAVRLLPADRRGLLARALGRGRAADRLSAPLRRWLLLSASQGAGVCFNLGALASTLALVVFTDLSFGWSTTLDVEAAELHRVTRALAAPWSWLWPDAAPSIGLIEVTRSFRIAAGADLPVPPETYGGWWPFLVMAIATYGLLPRLLFFGFARWRLARALGHAIREAPGARRALDRLNSPLVETRAYAEEATPSGALPAAGEAAVPDAAAPPERAVVLSWADAVAREDAAAALACQPEPWLPVGGHRSLDDDSRAVERAAAVGSSDGAVIVAVRGFEPPLLEVRDFLGELRRALGDGREIQVATLGGSPEERQRWRRFLGALGDPWLALAPRREGSAPAPREPQ